MPSEDDKYKEAMDFLTRMLLFEVGRAGSRCKSESGALYVFCPSLLWPGAFLLWALIVSAACGGSTDRVEPVYDQATGRLQLLKYDANGDGNVDTWSYMEGPRVVRIEIDTDHNAVIDRWEYYGPDETLEKVGSSRGGTGNPDSWAFYASNGAMARLELSLKQNGVVDRIEYYAGGTLTRAEEDTNGDNRIDKWEAYDGRRLASVAFDTTFKGEGPDRRLTYAPDGTVRPESLPPPPRP